MYTQGKNYVYIFVYSDNNENTGKRCEYGAVNLLCSNLNNELQVVPYLANWRVCKLFKCYGGSEGGGEGGGI